MNHLEIQEDMYLGSKERKFLREAVHHIPGMSEYVNFKERHYTITGVLNGLVFEAFGDQWTLILFPDNNEILFELTEDYYSRPHQNSWGSRSYTLPMNIQNISDFLDTYYFRTL